MLGISEWAVTLRALDQGIGKRLPGLEQTDTSKVDELLKKTDTAMLTAVACIRFPDFDPSHHLRHQDQCSIVRPTDFWRYSQQKLEQGLERLQRFSGNGRSLDANVTSHCEHRLFA